jgi:hypothetical protein
MPIDRARALGLVLLAAALGGAATPAPAVDEPMSAIDWLSRSVEAEPPALAASAPAPATADEPPVAPGGALPAEVATAPLAAGPRPDAAGLIPPAVSGLPADLWGRGEAGAIAAQIALAGAGQLPALRQLFLTLLLAEALPPSGTGADPGGAGSTLLLARVDKLLQLGALEQAAALMDAAGVEDAALFRRAFDVALLTGREERACRAMLDTPAFAPTFPARIYCLARMGDWGAAALSLRTGAALGHVTPAEEALLSRFLDPDLFEGEEVPPPPQPVTPLVWTLYEAIGEALPTQGLPLAFAQAELDETAGWKAQIEAAERLTRAGVVAPNKLLGLYTEREAAASGGVWDRVEAFAAFDAALAAGDPGRVAQTLPTVWLRMAEAELEVAFAQLHARALSALALEGEAGAIAFRVALLSPLAGQVAARHPPRDAAEAFLAALARGDLSGVTPPDSMARAIAPAFLAPEPSQAAKALVDGGRRGEAILTAMADIRRGTEGDLRGVTEGLSLLRALGLEEVARRTALELMILDRRG